MVTSILISSGLILIPFLGLLGFNGREPRMMLSVFIALLLSLWGFYKGSEPLKNKWLLFFVGYLLVSAWYAPKPVLFYVGYNISNFFFWKPFAMILAFLGMYTIVSSNLIKRKLLIEIMVWVGFIMSILCIGHLFNLHQWGNPEHYGYYQVAGMLNNPLIVGTFIAMLIPLAIYVRRFFFSVVMMIAVFCTCSQVAIWSMIISLFVLLGSFKRTFFMMFAVLILMFIGLSMTYIFIPKTRNLIIPKDNGRIAQWKNIIQDLKEPALGKNSHAYPWTGYGLGSFKYLYPLAHPSSSTKNYDKAHNEYLQILWELGIVGFIFFISLLSLKFMSIDFNYVHNKFLFSSLICSLLAAGGMFVWHLGPHCFYVVTIAGMITKKK